MKKTFSTLLLIALGACTYDQTPAPYEAYGNTYYGKGGQKPVNHGNNSPMNHTTSSYTSTDLSSTSNQDDYNRRIDEHNSSAIVAHPIVNKQNSGETYSYQNKTDSSGNSMRPLAPMPIDGDQQVVRLNNGPGLIHSGNSYAANDASRNTGYNPPSAPESVPPVEGNEKFVNPSQLNQERKVSRSLDYVHPVPKPKLTEESTEETVKPAPAASTQSAPPAKAKITPQVKKVETSMITDKPAEKHTSVKPTASEEPIPEKPVKKPAVKPAQEEDVPDDSAQDEEELAPTTAPATKTSNAPSNKILIAKPAESVPAASEEDAPEEAEKTPAVTTSGKAQPFIKPVDGQVISEFGSDKAGGGFNDGIGIQAPEGTPVKAAAGGTVVYSGNQLQGYGNLIIIRHPNGFLSSYSHLKELELKKGEAVKQGEVVGHVGKTGNVESPQLYFGIRKGREPVDPKNYL